jgi:hypothetical protein
MSAFDGFLREIVSGAEDLARTTLTEAVAQAREDTEDFLRETESDLRRWTQELAAQELSQAEFEDLVKGEADLARLHALTEAGIALARLDRFRDGLINLVVNTAIRTFLP